MDLIDQAAMREEAFRDATQAGLQTASRSTLAEFGMMSNRGGSVPVVRFLLVLGCPYYVDCQQLLECEPERG